jgi:hypothetical protein|tara:strand:+ start:4331 stop:4693 length:363 start_codon:yes stop_codon:yes gene_type:complete
MEQIDSKTLFLDIDGTLVKHENPSTSSKPSHKMVVLEGTIDKILEWNKKGYTIILTTGRRESNRELTIKQLQEAGIFYDQLIMGVGRGPRVVINDLKPDGKITAYSINIERNKGLKEISL